MRKRTGNPRARVLLKARSAANFLAALFAVPFSRETNQSYAPLHTVISVRQIVALMTELEALERRIGEFKTLIDDAWRSLSRSSLTTFERRELRNEMKRSGAELQRCLELVQAERERSRMRLSGDHSSGRRIVDFRLIGRSEPGKDPVPSERTAPAENAF
jgi:hypothetical protein